MTLFWIFAGLLLAGALLFVVPPLSGVRRRRALAASRREANISIYRDQMQELETDLAAGTLSTDQYEQARRELESRVLEDTAVADSSDEPASQGAKWLPLVVGASIPVLAVSLYLVLGNPRGLDPLQTQPPQAAASGQAASEVTSEQITGMVNSLAAKLKQNPNNPQGWVMLARSYNVLQRFPEAVQAYEKAAEQAPNDGQLLADYADALAMVQGGDLSGKPADLIEKSLKLDPNNIKGLALSGTVAFEKGNYAVAVTRWQKAASLLPPESEFARSIQSSIAEAQQKGGLAQTQPAASVAAAATNAGGSIAGTVQLSPELAAKVSPSDTVFVFARAASGPRMPLAIVRKQVKDLPVSFSLDDSMAMAPNMKLSSFPQVVVGARISKSGNAMPQPGDLESGTQPATLGATALNVVINAEVGGSAAEQGGLPQSQPPAAQQSATPAAAAAGGSIAGTVQLSPELAAKVSPSDTVFVFARAASGPRMPLAIVRKQVKDLPVSFSLDDSMAMAPNMKLSSFPQVVVGARISKSGNAMPQPGDLESGTQPAALGVTGLNVVIKSEVK